jgi:hypothetical protein
LLVGIAGRSGAFVDQLAGLCVKIDPASGAWVGGVYETARAPGPVETKSSIDPEIPTDTPNQTGEAQPVESPPSDEGVTDRGLGTIALRPSGTVVQAIKPSVTTPVVVPDPPKAASAPVVRPAPSVARELSVAAPAESRPGGATVVRQEQLSAEVLTGPRNTKRAILTIQSSVGTAPLAAPKPNLQLRP